MAPISLETVSVAQEILRAAGVDTVVTGDFGLSYHGVDIVVHDVELCVRSSEFTLAIEAIRAQSALYQQLPDISEPNFYHPYKQDAARFVILDTDEAFELHIVPNQRLGFEFRRANIETNMTGRSAHTELQHLCDGVDDAALRSIRWPSLIGFVRGWLQLAETYHYSYHSMIYLMQAERLLDASNVDEIWCEKSLVCPVCVDKAKELVRGRQRRQIKSTWT